MRRTLAFLLLAAVAALPACGGSQASDRDGPTVTLRVTKDFGNELLLSAEDAPIPDRPTVLRLLRDHADVKTSDSGIGTTIEAIEGEQRISDNNPARGVDRTTTWMLIVNGIEADLFPNEYPLHDGDVVQLDLRDWYVTRDVRATVGAFPETFSRGTFGRRFSTELECAPPDSAACGTVRRALRRAGVAVDGSPPGGPPPPKGDVQRARILVGAWPHWRDRDWPSWIDEGASRSGVFAKFIDDAARIRLLDWDEDLLQAVGAGSGLVGAIRPTEPDLLWIVTGVDEEGVERAASALVNGDVRDAFGAVVTGDGVDKVPLPPVWPRGDDE